MEYMARFPSPLGDLLLSSDGKALTGLWFEGQRRAPSASDEIIPAGTVPALAQTVQWLEEYFSGREPGFTPPLRMEGTPFRRTVWELLLAIPYGKTATYGEIACAAARELGVSRMSAQAVGGAVGRNPISLIVPCHRVVGRSGDLTGYGGGLDRKLRLLTLEGTDMSSFFLPGQRKPR